MRESTYFWEEEIREWDIEENHDAEEEIELPSGIGNSVRSNEGNDLEIQLSDSSFSKRVSEEALTKVQSHSENVATAEPTCLSFSVVISGA